MTFFADNIRAVLSYATPDQITEGMTWYARAHEIAAAHGDGDVWRSAGVFAAFSPQTPWNRNIMLATTALDNNRAPEGGTLGNSIRAAARILAGEHSLDVLGGLKTRAFCDNIATAGVSDEITVDVHAFSIAMGTPVPASKMTMGKRLYADIAFAYREVAEDISVHGPQVQAITWVVWRELHDVKARHHDNKVVLAA